MSRDEALRALIRFAAREVRCAGVPAQIEIFQALSILCPKDEAREHAHQIQLQLEALNAQQDLFLHTHADGSKEVSGDGNGGTR